MAEMDLEKSNMDGHMLRYEAIKLARKCYTGKYVESMRMTNLAKDDPSSAVMAGLLSKLDLTKKAIG